MKRRILYSQDNFWNIVSRPTRLSLKLSALGLLFLLIYIRIFDVFIQSKTPTIPDQTYLFVSIAVIVYIWLRESIDSQRYLFSQNELISLQYQLRDEQTNTISSLILSQEAKDSYTRGHTVRVTKYAILLAKRLGLPEQDIGILRRAALLHDIGKIGITDLVLGKTGKLNTQEKELIREHVVLGENILEPLEFLKKERQIASQHHEHFDGTGYPRGLKGDKILLEARILAVCDFYDAVNSDRPYRKALSQLEIIAELKKNRGSQFDPQLADLLLEAIEKEKAALKNIAQSER